MHRKREFFIIIIYILGQLLSLTTAIEAHEGTSRKLHVVFLPMGVLSRFFSGGNHDSVSRHIF